MVKKGSLFSMFSTYNKDVCRSQAFLFFFKPMGFLALVV